MKRNHRLPLLLCLLAWLSPALRGEPFHSRLSPDGRFRFTAFSVEDFDSGRRPAFGIIETATGNLVSDPEEELGDAFRPSEIIYWSPDSLSFAIISRVGTRHIDTFLYRWNGERFSRAVWQGDAQLEAWADREMEKNMAALGLPAGSGKGQCLRGDDLVERWIDPARLVLRTELEHLLGEGGDETYVEGYSRALVKWNPVSQAFEIERELPIPAPWPYRIEPDEFMVTQAEPASGETLSSITVTRRADGSTRSFKAENWLTAPLFLHTGDDWPGLELVNKGPEGFEWRRIYRLIEGNYRCVRVAELTHLSGQAPEGAPLLELDPGSFAIVLRDREPGPDDPDTYESFQTESPAPGGKWKAVFTYHPQYLQRIEVLATDGGGEPSVIYDFDEGLYGIEALAEPLWNPDGSALALYLQDGPRTGSTLLYRLRDGVWSEADRPEIGYEFLQEIIDGGETSWGQQLELPLFWKSPRDLVLSLVGHFRGEQGFDYRAVATLSWDPSGKPSGCVATRTSPE
ncbi:MAG: hypothetical protein KDN18_16050 [Verrucomicrobiae bacterium]|nr:hypothetical protein [Verrucomicrobiae bacterium]